MALASLKSRIERLEAKHKTDATKVVGVIGGVAQLIVDPDKPGHLKFSEPPGGFPAFARNQQNALQSDLIRLFADMADDPKAAFARDSVGNSPAPLKPGQKQPNFIHLADGTEIKIKRN